MRRITILGSTGSIGVQALDVIEKNPQLFDVVGLSAGTNRALVAEQAARFGVEHVALGTDESVALVRHAQ